MASAHQHQKPKRESAGHQGVAGGGYTPPLVGPWFRRNLRSYGIQIKRNRLRLTDPNSNPTQALLGGPMRRYHAITKKRDDDELNTNPPTPCQKQAPAQTKTQGQWPANHDDDDDELNINPPTPFQIGKRPPAERESPALLVVWAYQQKQLFFGRRQFFFFRA